MIKKLTQPKYIHIIDNIYYQKYLFQKTNFKLVFKIVVDDVAHSINYVDDLKMCDIFTSYDQLDEIRKLLDPYCIEKHEFHHHDAYGDLYLRNLNCLNEFQNVLSELLIMKKFGKS